MINRRTLFVKILIVAVILMATVSCTAYKKLPYLKQAEKISQNDLKKTAGIQEFKITPKDVLSITVNASTPEAVKDFNLSLVPSNLTSLSNTSLGSTISLQTYVVDKDGYIQFPVLGRLKVAGLTRNEAELMIQGIIHPQYTKDKVFVNIRCLNFKITVMGEVAKPGVYSSENDKITILEALALAGDLTIYGKRQNVMLLRESSTGELSVHRINLQDRNILFQKDIFYLQQNDKIIVEPNKTRGNNSGIGTLESLGLSAVSILISVIAIVTR